MPVVVDMTLGKCYNAAGMDHSGNSFFSVRRSTQWAICLMCMWLLLNVLDITTTYQALSTGNAVELNPLMGLLIGAPLLLVTTKMLLAYAAVKVVERIELRSSCYAVLSLLVLNIYVVLVCSHNAIVWLNR